MTIAFDASAGSVSSGSVTSYTQAITVGSGSNRILFVTVSLNAGVTTGVTYAGSAMTLIDAQAHTGLGDCSLWYIVNPASGTNNIVSTSSISTFHVINASSYTGASQTGVPNAFSKASGSALNYTSVVTAIGSGCWHVCGTRSSAGSISAGSGTTMRANGGANGGILDSNGIVSGTSTLNITAGSTANYAIVGATFAPIVTSKGNFFIFF